MLKRIKSIFVEEGNWMAWTALILAVIMVLGDAIFGTKIYRQHEEEVKKIVRETIREELKNAKHKAD